MPINKEYHDGQELTVSDLGLSLEEMRGQPLELFAREQEKFILLIALEEEATEFPERRRYEHSHGNYLGNCGAYRDGHQQRQVTSGANEVTMPQVSDTKEAFGSQLLEAWQRRS